MNKLLKKSIALTLMACLIASSAPVNLTEASDPMKDVRFRKALTLAINRDELIKEIKTPSNPAMGLIPNGVLLSDGTEFRKRAGDYGIKRSGNLEEAKRLLADAGYPGGKGIPKYTLYYNTNNGVKAYVENVKKQWKQKLGVEVDVVNEEWEVFLDRRYTGNFDIARASWIADYHDPMTFLDLFTQYSGNNDSNWKNEEYDQLIEKSKFASGKERDTLLIEAEKILMQDMPLVPLYYLTTAYQLKSSVKNAQVDNLNHWYLGRASVPGGKLIWNIGSEPRTLDPSFSTESDGINILNNTFEGLMRNENNKIVPATAESFKLSADKKTYTFKIRNNAKWSDGKAVTANDFVYSWKRNIDMSTNSPYAFMFNYIEGVQDYREGNVGLENVGIKAIDKQTLQVKLTAPTPYFADMTCFPVFFPLRKDMVVKNSSNWSMNSKTAISNGPFRLKEVKEGYGVYLVANQNWWNAKSNKIKSIDAIAIVDDATAVTAYEQNDIHLNTLIPEAEYEYLKANDKTFKTLPILRIDYLIFNMNQ